jgi:hypothetical protein
MFEDHKRKGKKFFPPMNHLFQDKGWTVEQKNVSHELQIVPEIIWIDLLNQELGNEWTSEILTHLSTLLNQENKPFGVFNSSFQEMTDNSVVKLKRSSEFKDYEFYCTKTLEHFLNIFPDNPLNRLFKSNKAYEVGTVDIIRTIVEKLNDRNSYRNTIALSHVLYSGAIGGIVKLSPTLKNPSELLNYPDTELSEKMGSIVRASIKPAFGFLFPDLITNWNNDFWTTCAKFSNWKVTEIETSEF